MPRSEDRAASEVIGAVIIFGFLIIAFTIYQGVVIPQQNKAIEFDHNEDAQDAIQELRNAIRQTATTAAEESVSITLGASYPPRVLGINPGASAGSIQTESLPPISIRNVKRYDPETADYFGRTTTTLGSFQTKAVIYRPIYFQYSNSPDTLYENSLAYNQFPGGANLTITNQAVIDDRKITLIAIDGNVSEARQGTVSIDTKALSTASNTVSITNDSGPINITFGTRLTAEDWNETLQGELTANGGHVTDVRQTGPNQVSIILQQGITYDLRLAKVGVGDDTSPRTRSTSSTPRAMTPASSRTARRSWWSRYATGSTTRSAT
ncbi:MAG: hypothetical protein U5J98_08035 [Halobacteriales archaeon]|nr:hypothetical protein [Halobacteriales archaeon]